MLKGNEEQIIIKEEAEKYVINFQACAEMIW